MMFRFAHPTTKNLTSSIKLFGLPKQQLRLASFSAANDPASIKLLERLEKFDKRERIFEKLDELCHLSAQKGFFNLDLNDLGFLSNNKKINDGIKNLYSFNDLNKLVSDQYVNGSLLATPITTINKNKDSSLTVNNNIINTANLKPIPRFTSTNNANNIFHATSVSNLASSLPGFNAFLASSSDSSKNKSVDKYLNILHGLARNDVELKKTIEQVLDAFRDEDDQFFDYVLKFWQRGKSLNKQRAQKLRDESGNDQLPINLTMH